MKEFETILNTYFKLIKDDTFDFEKFNQFSIVYHSNSIEGSTLTKEETFLLLAEHLTPKNKPLEYSLMAVDHLEALKYVVDLGKNSIKLSSDIIKNIAALVMKNTGSEISAMAGNFDSSKGDFRKLTVRAGTSTFIDYKKVPERVSLLVAYINKNIDSVNGFKEVNELAFDAHYQLVSIHPFADGNGRVSRLLMNYIQQYHKLPLSIIYKESKQEYFDALINTRKKKDIAIFRKYMFAQTKTFLLEQIKILEKKPNFIKGKNRGMSFLF